MSKKHKTQQTQQTQQTPAGKPKSWWHPVFCLSLPLEFQDYIDNIEIKSEEELSETSRHIDAIIIIVKQGIKIRKNIAEIFKTHNIFEYKSPSVSLSIDNFYNAQSYVLQYAAMRKYNATIDDVTLSFVVTRKPAALFKHLKGRCEIINPHSGIYHITGYPAPYPIQIIVNRELEPLENRYLRSLRNEADEQTARMIIEAEGIKDFEIYNEYVISLLSVNPRLYKEVIDMNPAAILKRTFNEAEREEFFKSIDKAAVKFGWIERRERELAEMRRAIEESERREKEFERREKESERREKESERREKEALEEARLLREELKRYKSLQPV